MNPINIIVEKVRKSLEYAKWVERNLNSFCSNCNTFDKKLVVHHIIPLHEQCKHLLNIYKDNDYVFKKLVNLHRKPLPDNEEAQQGITFCEKCHKSKHPRSRYKQNVLILTKDEIETRKTDAQPWSVMPRNFKHEFNYSQKHTKKNAIGSFTYRFLIITGWYILQNQLIEGRYFYIEPKEISRQMKNKKIGLSFHKSLKNSLNELRNVDIISAFTYSDDNIEIILSKTYLQSIGSSPWFVALTDAHKPDKTKTDLFKLILKLRLTYNQRKKFWRVSIDKFMQSNWMNSKLRKDVFIKKVINTCNEYNWVKVERKDDTFTFRYTNKITPVYTLRDMIKSIIYQWGG